MATQLAGSSRGIPRMSAGANRPSRITRQIPGVSAVKDTVNLKGQVNDIKNTAGNVLKKPLTLNFIAMVVVAAILDAIGLFADEFPGVGIVISVLADVVFIPWFYFSGIKFNSKRIASMMGMNILEDIPFVGNLPFILINVIYSYYSS